MTGRRPSTASSSSVWPLPDTPATPTISPDWTSNTAFFTARRPSVLRTETPLTTSAGLVPAGSRSAGSGGTLLPTIGSTSSSSVIVDG